MFGLPEYDQPGKIRLTGNRAKTVISGKRQGKANLARNGNMSMPVVENARRGDAKNPFPIKTPEDPFAS